MNITKERIKDFYVLKIEGRFDSPHSAILEAEILDLYNRGEKNIIFDLTGLNYISSSGLRVFLIAQKKAIASQGKLHLCNMQPPVRETFSVIGFSSMFRIFDTREEALEL